jgi:hypothetical protein
MFSSSDSDSTRQSIVTVDVVVVVALVVLGVLMGRAV